MTSAPFRFSSSRLAVLLVAFAALAVGCEVATPAPAEPPAEPTAVAAPRSTGDLAPAVLVPTAAGLAIDAIDAQIASTRVLAAAQGGWIRSGQVATLYLHRARLSGDVGDYLRAEAALEAAFTNAVAGSGPLLTRASFNMTVHRAELVEADLVQFERRPLKKDEEIATIAGLRGDVALQQGDRTAALAAFERAEVTHPTVMSAGRIAGYHRTRGDFDEAARWYERAIERADGEAGVQRAWALVQRGELEFEQQRFREALEYFERANASFDGWFMVEGRIAAAKLELGDVEEAITLYESVVARVPDGASMAGLSEAWKLAGDEKKAAQWQSRAAAAFERDIRRMPSAVSSHALDFFLTSQPQRALEIARQNAVVRPGPQSRAKLAQALLINGRSDEARQVLAAASP